MVCSSHGRHQSVLRGGCLKGTESLSAEGARNLGFFMNVKGDFPFLDVQKGDLLHQTTPPRDASASEEQFW